MSEKKISMTPQSKRYPNNLEAEQSLIGSILMDGNVAANIVSLLTEDFFYQPKHQKVIKACKELYFAGFGIDHIVVYDQMIKNGDSDESTLSYLYDLTRRLPSSANYPEYFRILSRDRVLRKIIDSCNSIIANAYDSDDENETLKLAEKLIFDISSNVTKGDLTHIAKAVTDFVSDYDKKLSAGGTHRGMNTYYPIFDNVTNGLQKGDLIILAARPSVGKTSFALNIVANIANASKESKVMAIFSLEMPSMQLVQRLLSNIGDLPMNDLSGARVSEERQDSFWSGLTTIQNSKIYVDDTSMVTPGDILSKCRRLATKERKIDLVVVDYLQLMSGSSKKNQENRQQEISECSRLMKILAKEMNCPVIVISQMSRGIEGRDDKTPKLSDLRESGSIEQDADIVIFLTRENEEDKGKTSYDVILDISKHRNGELKAIRYVWEGPFIRFSESTNQIINRELVALQKKSKYND